MTTPDHHHVAMLAAQTASNVCTYPGSTERYTPEQAAAKVTAAYRAALAELAKPLNPEQPKE